MPITPVSSENDLSCGPGCHLFMATYVPDLFECVATMNWSPGKWLGTHSLSKNVRFNGQTIVLDGHDVGPGLSHMPASDVWRMLKSSRKNMYSAAKVIANGVPLACIDEDHWMMTCGDPISLPSGFNTTNAAHNLMIGMSELDELKGRVAIACSVITDVIMVIVSPPGHPGSKDFELDGSKVCGSFMGISPEKALVSGAVGIVGSLVVSAATGWQEPVTVKLSQGNSYASAEVSASYYPKTGAVSGSVKGNDLGRRTAAKGTWGDKL